MDSSAVPAKSTRLAMIWTRDIPDVADFGRLRTMSLIKSVGDAQGARHFRLASLVETKRAAAIAGAFGSFVVGLLCGRPVPLQVLLFSDRSAIEKILNELRRFSPTILYLDGVRTALLLKRIQKATPTCRIVVDFDDLQSLRMKIYRDAGLTIGLGYLSDALPPFATRLLMRLLRFRWVLKYEEKSLAEMEQDLIELADEVVLVSRREVTHLSDRVAVQHRSKIVAIPPPAPPASFPTSLLEPITFCFVGADDLIQNRLSIDYLLDTWERLAPKSRLHIYGRMRRRYPPIPNVDFAGFAPDLAVALRGKVLIVPAFIGGGIKTKVLEGFGAGCPVVGTVAAFEGLSIEDYPLIFEDLSAIDQLILCPEMFRAEFRVAASRGLALAMNELSRPVFEKRWTDHLAPAEFGHPPSRASDFTPTAVKQG